MGAVLVPEACYGAFKIIVEMTTDKRSSSWATVVQSEALHVYVIACAGTAVALPHTCSSRSIRRPAKALGDPFSSFLGLIVVHGGEEQLDRLANLDKIPSCIYKDGDDNRASRQQAVAKCARATCTLRASVSAFVKVSRVTDPPRT